jgi:hypothetical protein
MNLHRYKVTLTLPGSGETKYEFVGTWIGFGGLLLLFALIGIGEDIRSVFGGLSICIGVHYGLYWLSTQHKLAFLFLVIFTFCLSLYLFQYSLGSLIECKSKYDAYSGSSGSPFLVGRDH